MFEEIPNYIVLFSLNTHSLRKQTAVFPKGKANQEPYLLWLCDHTASLPFLRLALNRKEVRCVLSVKRRAITLSFTDSRFVVSHPMTVR